MVSLKIGYLISAVITAFILLIFFFTSLPDGKLHIVFCNVGQGDAAYIRFPDGQDMVADGGPDDRVLDCLGRHMPFWDRTIDLVLSTHPQKDHLQGLISVVSRYHVGTIVRSDVANASEGFQKFMEVIAAKKIPIRYQTTGNRIRVGSTTLSFLWPSTDQIAKAHESNEVTSVRSNESTVLGATIGDLNEYCLVFALRYGTFDAVFPGDADDHVEPHYTGMRLADGTVEVLKVPHHGSKTGMTNEFVTWIRPKLAIISVGKNTFGHPTPEALKQLVSVGARVLRTDREGDIEIVSDGNRWWRKW